MSPADPDLPMQLTRGAVLALGRENDLKLFPCRTGTKLPLPVHGFRSTPEEVESAFTSNPVCNLALVAGAASGGVIGIDCETEDVAWSLFDQRERVLSSTWCLRTPHGGIAVLLRATDAIPARRIRIAGEDHPFDICGEGGYFLIWGTLDHTKCDPKKAKCPHVGTSRYETISRTCLIENAQKVEENLFARCDSLGWTVNGRRWPKIREIAGGVSEGERNRAAFVMSRYLLYSLRMSEKDALFGLEVWNQRNQPPLIKDELERVLSSARKYPRATRGRDLWGALRK